MADAFYGDPIMPETKKTEWCSHCVSHKEPKQMERTGLCKACAQINAVMARALAKKLHRSLGL